MTDIEKDARKKAVQKRRKTYGEIVPFAEILFEDGASRSAKELLLVSVNR